MRSERNKRKDEIEIGEEKEREQGRDKKESKIPKLSEQEEGGGGIYIRSDNRATRGAEKSPLQQPGGNEK